VGWRRIGRREDEREALRELRAEPIRSAKATKSANPPKAVTGLSVKGSPMPLAPPPGEPVPTSCCPSCGCASRELTPREPRFTDTTMRFSLQRLGSLIASS
jgi:hypothetical protein